MDKLECTTGVIRCRKLKEWQYNGKKKKDKRIDLHNSKQKAKDSTIDGVNSGAAEGSSDTPTLVALIGLQTRCYGFVEEYTR